jgi:hypothetical protein
VRGGVYGGSFAFWATQLLAIGSFGVSFGQKACPAAGADASSMTQSTVTAAIMRRLT